MKKLIKFPLSLLRNYKNKKIISNYSNLLAEACNFLEISPFIICDVGARDNIVHPWDIIDKIGKVLTHGFEPDPTEAKLLKETFPTRSYHPFAASDNDGTILLHIANDPGCSSIYPPNLEYIEKYFLMENSLPRHTVKTVEIPCRRIDTLLDDVDFIKSDTQGYEFEVLSGASKILHNSLAIIAECWSVPIHKGQRLTHDVTKYMYQKKFEILSIQNGTWRRNLPEKYYLGGGTSPVWQEVLFFNTNYGSLSREKQKKLVMLLLIYGHYGFASNLAKNILGVDINHLLEKYFKSCNPFNPYVPNLHH